MVHEMSNAITGDVVATCELFGVHMDRNVRRAADFPTEILNNAQKYLCAEKQAAE
jgi:acyl-CoA thioester hydrolase